MNDRYDVLVVGAGQGGAQVAAALRQLKFDGTVALLGEEPDAPYERPPLSKEYLAGDKPFERLLLRAPGFWPERGIELLLGRRVVAVDSRSHRVQLEDGSSLGYGRLVWATGGAPRTLACAGHDLPGVHAVRTRADVDRLKSELAMTARVVVVGGGYIGLEGASVLAKLGKHVTILEAQGRVLARVAGEALSRFFEREHRAHGVDVRLGVEVACVEERDGRASGVRLASGEVVTAEMVIVGIGIVPAVAPLLEAGAAGSNGVLVDLRCQTRLPDVFAIGDCAAHPNVHARGVIVRLESVQNANDQATVAAKVILGEDVCYDALPWFWSNQYDLRLQTVGLSTGHDETVLRGDARARSFSVVYLREGKVIALDCVNAARDFVQGKALVAAGRVVDRKQLADSDVPLKALAS